MNFIFLKISHGDKKIEHIEENKYKTAHRKVCEGCGEEYSNAKKPHAYMRNDDDCSIYYKLLFTSHKFRPVENCNTVWGAEKDLENT